MDPVVTVENSNVPVEPGGQATVRVRVQNRSGIVEGFRIDVVGDAAGWAKLYPPEIEVPPQAEAETMIIFSPPAGAASRAGLVPFGVRAVSQVNPSASAVAEGDLSVGSVAQSQARITPTTSKGRFGGKHRIEMANWGNAPVRLALEVSDPDEALGFLLAPDVLDLPLGVTGTARLKVRARKPFFRGAPVRRPFRVVGRPIAPGQLAPAEGPTPQFGYDPTQPSVDGAFEQRPLLGRGLIPLAILLIGGAALVGWLTTRGGDEEESETARPPTPQGFAAEAISADTVRLQWEPSQRIDGYKVLTLDPATVEETRPTATEVSEVIPADQGSADVTELEPASQQCFQLVAMRNDVESDRTEPQCVQTLQVAGPEAPPGPGEVAAAPAEDNKARVTWQDASGGQASHLVLRNGTVVQEVAAPVTEALVDTVTGENCFQVQAKQGDVLSEPSPEQCLTVETGSAPEGGAGGGGPVVLPSGGGGGTGTDGGDGGGGDGGGGDGEAGTTSADLGVIAVVGAIPVEDIDAEARANQQRDQLRGQDIEASVLDTRDFPALADESGRNFFYVYVPGFTSEEEAQAFCDTNQFPSCIFEDLSGNS